MCKIIKDIIPFVLHYLIMILNKNCRKKFTKSKKKKYFTLSEINK